MSDNYLHEEFYNGKTIVILSDEYAQCNPRDDEGNLGVMICFHNHHNLGDQHDYAPCNFNGWEGLRFYLESKMKACIIHPLWVFEHGDILIQIGEYTGPDARWDAGQVGYIYTTKERIRNNWNIKRVTPEYMKRADDLLHAEVELYSAYLQGDVVGYQIKDEDEVVDSCWGYLGCFDQCLQDAKDAIDYFNTPHPPPKPRPSRKLTIPT